LAFTNMDPSLFDTICSHPCGAHCLGRSRRDQIKPLRVRQAIVSRAIVLGDNGRMSHMHLLEPALRAKQPNVAQTVYSHEKHRMVVLAEAGAAPAEMVMRGLCEIDRRRPSI